MVVLWWLSKWSKWFNILMCTSYLHLMGIWGCLSKWSKWLEIDPCTDHILFWFACKCGPWSVAIILRPYGWLGTVSWKWKIWLPAWFRVSVWSFWGPESSLQGWTLFTSSVIHWQFMTVHSHFMHFCWPRGAFSCAISHWWFDPCSTFFIVFQYGFPHFSQVPKAKPLMETGCCGCSSSSKFSGHLINGLVLVAYRVG